MARQFPPYSDANFVSLTSWNRDNTAQVSLLLGNMVVQLPDYIGSALVTTLVGNSDLPETASQLVKSADRICARLELIPEHIATVLRANPG